MRKESLYIMKPTLLVRLTQGRNAIRIFLNKQAARNTSNNRIAIHRFSLAILGVTLVIGLYGCIGPSKVAFMKQFDAKIGQHKDKLITEMGLPARGGCTPLDFGEACQWEQINGPPFLEGPLEGTFPGDSLTYFLDSKRMVCQWRFQGRHNGTQHSASQCLDK